MITVQRIFAIDAGAIERGMKVVGRANPTLVEILPALAYPRMAAQYPDPRRRPTLAGGLLQSMEEVTSILEAGSGGGLNQPPGSLAPRLRQEAEAHMGQTSPNA